MKKNKSITLFIIIAIFALPIIFAWLIYSKGTFLPSQTVNHGVLLIPSIPLSALSLQDTNYKEVNSKLHGKWWLIYFTDSPKDNFSRRNLYYMKQIRQATGKDQERIQRAILTLHAHQEIEQWINQQFPGTYHFILPPKNFMQLKSSFSKELALEKGSLYLVDPLGNIIMFYAPNVVPKGILKDLELVLKVSQIG